MPNVTHVCAKCGAEVCLPYTGIQVCKRGNGTGYYCGGNLVPVTIQKERG